MTQPKTIAVCGLLAVMALCVAWPSQTRAASPASDNSCNTPYSTGGIWTNGQNGGYGFAAWGMTPLPVTGVGTYFTGSAAANGSGCSSGGGINGSCATSWGMWTSNNTFNARRPFTSANGTNALQVGQVFTMGMDNGFINTTAGNGGTVGISLENSVSNFVFQFYFRGSSNSYSIADSVGNNGRSIGIPFTADGMNLSFALTSPTNYSFAVTTLSSNTTYSFTGSLSNAVGGVAIVDVRLFDFAGVGPDGGCNYDQYFNKLNISCPDPLTVTASPTNLAVCAGGTAVFNAVASGDAVTYQWQENGVNITNIIGAISGATTSNLTLTGVSSSNSGSNFECLVTDACTNTQTSAQAILTVNGAPSITAGTPVDQSPCAGSKVTFTVTASGAGLGYQWQKNGANISDNLTISGSTTTSLTLTNVQATDSGATFDCIVTSVCSLSSTSRAALLTVVNDLAVQAEPTNTTVCSGGIAVFTIGASGVNNYQWQKNGANISDNITISGSASAVLTLTNLSVGDSGGEFSCLLTGCGNSQMLSSTGTLTVIAAPGITSSPTNLTVCAGGTASFTVSASNAASFQWMKGAAPLTDNATINGSASATLNLIGVGAGDSGSLFSCMVSGASPCSPVASGAATLTVSSPPGISVQPVPATVCSSGNASFTVTAMNAASYHWQKGATLLTDNATINGSATPTLTLTGVGGADNGSSFSCILGATAPCPPLTSSAATLTVSIAPPAITGEPTPESVCSNTTAAFAVTATGGTPAYFWRKRGAGWGGGGWAMDGAGSNGSFYVQSSTQNGVGDPGANGNIDTSGVAWGISAFNGGVLEAIRPLNANIQVGQTFNIEMDNGYINGPSGTTSNSVGFNLRSGTTDRFVFVFRGGDTQYRIIDSSGNGVPTGIPFTDQGLQIAFTLTSTDTYSVTISDADTDGPTNLPVTITGTLEGTSGSPIDHVRFFNNNAGAGAANNAYFNSIGFGLRDDEASSYTSGTWTNGSDFGNVPLISGATGTGSTIVGANSSSLTISNVGTSDTANYDVWVTNSCGIAVSTPAALSIGQCGPYVSASNTVGSSVLEARVYQNNGYITLTGPDLNGNPGAVTLTFPPGSVNSGGNNYQIGPVLNSTPLSNGVQVVQSLGPTSIVVQVTFPYPGVMHYEVVNWGGLPLTATCLTVPSASSEHFYGFGEKFDALDQAGNKVHIMTHDSSARVVPDDTYAVAPWFVSSLGYGFHLDSTDESWFDMRNQYSDRYVISNMVGSSFSGYVTNALKYNVVYGPNLTDVISRYTGYKGRPLLPPQWAFMPWMSDDIWTSGGEVRYVISRYRALGIPGSVFVFDSPWSQTYNDFIWSTNQFAAAGTFENVSGGGSSNYAGFVTIGEMMTFLRTNGFKVVVWFTPFINTTSWSENYANCLYNVTVSGPAAENYSTVLASNYFVHAVSGSSTSVLSVAWWKGTGSPVDFTNPNAAQWFQATLSNLVSQSGGVIGGFKTDDGEAQASPTPFIPTNAQYYDGRTGVEMQNGYCVEYQKTVSAVLGTNGILWGRSGFAGSQTAPAIWAGDNEPNFLDGNGLPAVILAGEGCAMSGFSIWGSDICGYIDDSTWSSSTNNLFIRWAQFGAFSPIMQMHRQVGDCLMYPWRFSADALTNYEFYTQLRASLLPYIYSYATQASTSGLPILRPLVLMYPADPSTYGSIYNTSHSYLFGNEFLVAPVVTANATSRAVYLPQGHWFDFFSNQRYTGGQTITWNNANQHQMPLFVREGAVIPMISTNVQTALDSTYSSNANLITPGNALQFLIYPTTNSSFTVYDGTSLQCQSNGTVIAATLNSIARPVLLRFFTGQPFGVERDGVRLQSYTNATDFAAATLGWYYDAPSGFVQVKFNHAGGATTIMFGPDSVGDGISDSWRAYYFGNGNATSTNNQNCAACDPDGDGLSNAQEYRAGTNPNIATSTLNLQNAAFQVVSGTNDFIIYWPTEPGIHYRVLWKDGMEDAFPWQTNNMDFIGDGTIFNWLDDGSVTGIPPGNAPLGRRFYKVIVP